MIALTQNLQSASPIAQTLLNLTLWVQIEPIICHLRVQRAELGLGSSFSVSGVRVTMIRPHARVQRRR